MPKSKSVFFCKECGYESAKWMGQCPGCRSWNTFVEEIVDKKRPTAKKVTKYATSPLTLDQIDVMDGKRISTNIKELDRVLGGGIVPGSMILVGGDPGIGKSTLLLQTAKELTSQDVDVLYVSGEESAAQIKLRAERMGKFNSRLKLFPETDLSIIEEVIDKDKPQVVVIDSIQTMMSEDVSSAPGSVSQVRESTSRLMQISKGKNITVFVVGHVTKEGVVAGPRVLEHMVDTVLYFEGERHASYRILRGVKNRFGSTNEIGVFEMSDIGLKEVPNPSEYMLDGRPEGASGSVVACSLEGTRPILVEIQALLSRSNFAMPRRTAAGCDYNRVNLLMAVIEKRLGIRLGEFDAYVNIAGGVKMNEPAMDLGLVLAMISSYRERTLDPGLVCFGEVGLAGEVRSVTAAPIRITEAAKLGFKTVILPLSSLKGVKAPGGVKLIGIKSISEAMDYI
ncbi:MAG: DNA repair protein RadA [Lachnospiraceae bacterium]|nr:DNA repair protein RadA [Lachnospiraceae bacterium]